jgi:hypothetical protein
MQLVLEICDPKTECVSRSIEFSVTDVNALATLLQLDHFDSSAVYELDKTDIERLGNYVDIGIRGDAIIGRLRLRRGHDNLPYSIHTNRELDLMLRGIKPLASFVGQYPPHPSVEEVPERLFDPHVASGRFLKREYIELGDSSDAPRLRRVLYALAGEAWRMDAYILLLQTAKKTGWSEGFERMEGALLGYAEWQNDAHLQQRKVGDEQKDFETN